MEVGAYDLKLLYNVVPEGASYLADRDIRQIAKSTEFNHRPDVICVSGLTAGAETDSQILKQVKDALKKTPVFCNTGCNVGNIRKQLEIADGAITGTTFKFDGLFENAVDVSRVKVFMDEVRAFRKEL